MMNQIAATRHAGRINREAIEAGFSVAKPGVTLREVDRAIESHIVASKCVPIFKGYRGFPAASCLSPNEVVVHGVPNDYVLRSGDILTVDVGCSFEGWCVDSARTRVIGPGIFPLQDRLAAASESVLEAEISILQSGRTLLEIAKIAEQRAAELGVKIYPQWGGHQIGQQLHVDPFIPNCIDPKLPQIKRWQAEREYEKYKLQAGQVICLEPVVTFGETDIIVDGDGWTVRSADGSLVAHSERCILVTEKGYEILS
jgi:methionyl aminopeptidase